MWHHAYRRTLDLTCRFSHNCSQQVPSLREELRRLFKLVHPDLFHNHPEQQATNERSFQLLQDYLDAAKGHNSSRLCVYNFEFYYAHGKYEGGMKRVELSLPPPQVRRHPQRGLELLPATRSALGRLLSAFGLSSEFSGGLSSDTERVHLRELFQQASELHRQNATAAVGLEHRIVMVRNALRLGRGVVVSIRQPLSVRQQLETLEAVAQALDGAPQAQLMGCAIVIGDSCGLDGMGNLWLNQQDDVKFWSSFLAQVDFETVKGKMIADRDRRLKEFKAAHFMEIEMIFTNDEVAVRPEYIEFLDGIINDAVIRGAVGDGKFQELPVRVVDDDEEDGGEFSIDENMGYIRVPVSQTSSNIYKFIQDKGMEAVSVRKKVKMEEKRMEDMKIKVRKELRLRRLVFEENLRRDKIVSACVRLLNHSALLKEYTEGLEVCISDHHRLPSLGTKASLLHLKWNFDMADF